MVKKAIVPVAGYATRMLPITKVLPKAMLNVANKPVIEYIIDEIVEAGIEEILLITNSYSTIIQEHFSRNYELEYFLEKNNNYELLKSLQEKYKDINIYVKRAVTNQSLANSVYDAKQFIKNDPFLLVLGDEILENGGECTKKIIQVYEKTKSPVIAIKEVENEEKNKYGIVEGKKIKDNLYLINKMIEKPMPEETKSNLAIIGRYILDFSIFEEIKQEIENGNNDFTTSIFNLKNKKYGIKIDCERFDCGSKIGLIKANINFALKDNSIREDMLRYISDVKMEM